MLVIFNPELVRMASGTLLTLRDHADWDQSVECCGLLGGSRQGDEVWALLAKPLINTLQSPVRFEADPATMLGALRHFRENGLDWVGTYHSHPSEAPIPSRLDWERRQGNGMIDLILGRSLAFGKEDRLPDRNEGGDRRWLLRAWDLSGLQPRALPLIGDGWPKPVDPVYEVDLATIHL